MSGTSSAVSVLDDSRSQEREHLVELLTMAYWMEIETVMNYVAGSIKHYSRIVAETEEVDPVTQDRVIDILHDEQGHPRLFEGFLREYEQEGKI